MAERKSIVLSEEFAFYQTYIVEHQNYATLPNKKSQEGQITWVKVGDEARATWWDDLKLKLGYGDRASVARKIHPPELLGLKPCQVCGRQMSIYAIYPNLHTLRSINEQFKNLTFTHFGESVPELCSEVSRAHGSRGLEKLARLFKLELKDDNPDALARRIIQQGRFLSPGVMSNAPDRLDGFHSMNACCRSKKDKGRHSSNMAMYGTDRRAFENWAEGDWVGANRLMGKFKASVELVPCPGCGKSKKMTADHIGPISLGFTHRMEFQPLCIECNSKKNNRFTFADFMKLVKSEESGVQVISWHTKSLWDSLKTKITDDSTSNRARFLLRKHIHDVLSLLALIRDEGYEVFLERYLHPEYASYDYEFKVFDPKSGYFEAEKKPVSSANTRSKRERYLRISFEALDQYSSKTNRKNKISRDPVTLQLQAQTLANLAQGKTDEAHESLMTLLDWIAELASRDFYEEQ